MAVIYVLKCCDTCVKETYIGSTINFHRRMIEHKFACNNETSKKYNFPLYKFIRENGGWGSWEMNIIDSLTTTDKNEMIKCERKYIDEQEFRLNKTIPLRTRKEYHQDHKEKLNENMKLYAQDHREKFIKRKKQYYQDHKKEIRERHRQYDQEHKEELRAYHKQYRQDNKEKLNEISKKYAQDHKEEIAEYQKLYRETNRETINKKMNEKIQCDKCSATITRSCLRRHQKSMRCINTTTTTK